MSDESLEAIVTLDLREVRPYTESAWAILSKVAWRIGRAALEQGYWIRLLALPPNIEDSEDFGPTTKEILRFLTKRLPPALETEERLFLAFLSNPIDSNAGDALAADLNPSGLRPIDASVPAARKPQEQARALKVLRLLWEIPQVRQGIFAAYSFDASFPYLEEIRCTFDEMMNDLHHWFNADRQWKDRTYHVRK